MDTAMDNRSDWNREDDQQRAAGIAITYINNREVSHTARTLGFTASDFDTDLCALVSAAHQAQLFVNQRPVPQVTIFPLNPAAIHAVTNLGPQAGQSFSPDFCNMLTLILSVFTVRQPLFEFDVCLHGGRPKAEVANERWKKIFPGVVRANTYLAYMNAAAPLPPNHHEPQTIPHQKAASKALTMSAWQARGHNADRRSQAYLALPVPPNGKLPPAIQGSTADFTVKQRAQK
ncbi:hypothetical protein F5888DRAFT_1803455 [Russula emetica]|nr:hypothetical protein F5888DRAFT_1803455 [Russula emetica]